VTVGESRIGDYDWYDSYGDLPEAFGARWADVATRSKRGKETLRRLLATLEAMPVKRLECGRFVGHYTAEDFPDRIGMPENGVQVECCLLGAYVIGERMHSYGLTWEDAAEQSVDRGADEVDFEAVMAAEAQGMNERLAWRAVVLNDDVLGECTPEERWARAVEKIREWLDLPVLRRGAQAA
jgi:hypothetical protein